MDAITRLRLRNISPLIVKWGGLSAFLHLSKVPFVRQN